ncbi:glutamate-cysteine ligase family protein [Aeromicrobium wangtongii]|uniref:Glutamate-cysteine ligase family protein n=1 Tax=Aeromicrobium wangtongii TaxID=2969247 RepID=A0ABY5MAG8_9ACTN|nr:glutamate-cysteine ligase family protein [Aeromicrobium wangtongii]MCD9197638.1 glutamate-cysteine ligase family protein [Aeromicrobium wangtongii]UUP15125.1 glutamate-cysteine ligase family protein [Aeromicrobium wangtongii]
MGQDVDAREFSREDRTRYRAKVRRCLDVFARMLGEHDFSVEHTQVGIEIEFNLIDASGDPSLKNAEALDAIADPDFQTELGLFNVEINVPPARIDGDGLDLVQASLRDGLNAAQAKAGGVDARLLMIGILPTLQHGHFDRSSISANPRYHLLSEQILAARGEDIEIVIDGVDRLDTTADTIIPEAACTSTQLHLQVEPDEFAPMWNAAQAIAAVQVAVGANSPFLLGQQLWHETRIALFEQATDTRSEELKSQGVRPRVFFGERWITSVFDLFEENVRFFPSLLPIVDEEDPLVELEAGRVPSLGELRLHNGTIYRWNRPIYDIADGRPHLRIENRLLPAGPTVVDTMANAALFYGLVKTLGASERPVWSQLSFRAAEENFHAAARAGIEAEIYWPGVGTVSVRELTVRQLLPLAHAGLETMGVDAQVRDRLLGVIEQRCITGRNGATWLIDEFAHHRRSTDDRTAAMRATTQEYERHMHAGDPVHLWPSRS